MSRQPEKPQEVLEREILWVNKALERGFVKDVSFISASGSGLKGLVQGDITMKWTEDEQDEEHIFNGNLNSSGYGLIYSAEEDLWAEIVE